MISEPELTEVVALAVEAFETENAVHPGVDALAFAPIISYAHYCEVVAELIRVDMEWRRRRGRLARIADYLPRCQKLTSKPEAFAKVVFEEYRQRRLAGEAVEPLEYSKNYGVDVSLWPPILPDSARSLSM